MTHRTDVARGRDIVARWCGLAEQRLDHLTELYETGRWRRYYSEQDFLENIREARSTLDVWRGMLSTEPAPGSRPLDLSWIGRRSSVPPAKYDVAPEPALAIAPQLAELPVTPAASVVPDVAEIDRRSEPVISFEADEASAQSAFDKTLALTLDIAGTAGRYPLLRNAFQQTGNG